MDNRPTSQNPLFIMAMDHRASFGKSLFDVKDDEPTDAQRSAMQDAKRVIYAGLRQAWEGLDVHAQAAVLVDERYGQDVVDAAPRDGVVLAIPIEKSGQDWFGLEWGDQWRVHLERVRPAYAKVLVRDNPDFDADDRASQFAALRTVSDGLHELGIPLLYELLVPGTDEQLASVEGDKDRYDRDVRPALEVQVIADNQAAGIEPTIWKIEGLETAEAAQAVVAQIRSGGRGGVDVILLGRDAPRERLYHWIEVAAPVDGFVGFAIGRSIWEDSIDALHKGSIDEAAAVAAIAEAYADFARHYAKAAGA
jgi:myo-inositol catabolism protein IolC